MVSTHLRVGHATRRSVLASAKQAEIWFGAHHLQHDLLWCRKGLEEMGNTQESKRLGDVVVLERPPVQKGKLVLQTGY